MMTDTWNGKEEISLGGVEVLEIKGIRRGNWEKQ